MGDNAAKEKKIRIQAGGYSALVYRRVDTQGDFIQLEHGPLVSGAVMTYCTLDGGRSFERFNSPWTAKTVAKKETDPDMLAVLRLLFVEWVQRTEAPDPFPFAADLGMIAVKLCDAEFQLRNYVPFAPDKLPFEIACPDGTCTDRYVLKCERRERPKELLLLQQKYRLFVTKFLEDDHTRGDLHPLVIPLPPKHRA